MQYKELGFSGLAQFGGYISNEINTNLRGTEGVLTYRKMADTNATIGSLIHAITTLIQQAQADVIPHEDDLDVVVQTRYDSYSFFKGILSV